MTVHHDFKNWRSVSLENCTLNVYPTAVAKTVKCYDEIGSHEDCPRKETPRVTSAAEDKFIRITSLKNRKLTAPQIRAQINATQSSSSTHLYINCSEENAWIRPLWSNSCWKTTTKETQQAEEICLGKETQGMDIRPVEICAWVWWVQIRDLWFHPPCLCASTCMVPNVKQVWWCGAALLVTLLGIYSKLEAHWTSMATTAFCSGMPSHLVCFGPSFILQQDNDPKHTSRLCKDYLTKKESDGVLHQMTWPPQSPDLNPVQMVWDEMDHRVKTKGPTSAQHLWELLQDCWKTISSDDLMKLMERKYKAKGRYFKESRI